MRFLMIDRICELEPGVNARGIKNISWNDDFLEEFFPGMPIFSPVILAEAAAQLVSWAIVAARDFTVKPVITLVDSYRCCGHVQPGDQLEVRGRIESMSEEGALAHGSVLLAGRPVLEMQHAVCYLYPLHELDPPERARRQFQNLYVPGAALPAHEASAPQFLREHVPLRPLRWIDRILEDDNDRRIIAIKNVTATDDWFNDHFPNKPVLPGVVIIQCMISLARRLAERLIARRPGPAVRAVLRQSDKIKFRSFVQPGDQLLLQAEVKSFAEDASTFTATASVGGKNTAGLRLVFDHVTRETYQQAYFMR